ncbi:hypothetical protein QVD17_36393 [Tagetes erecta]|uniref:Uncharacterized protein n=1 Tax=Tagetes erecta TaxID=13708 RepID=A0AAD8NHC9_TARER|nr:hypothetical protein QVD17_36393 [Tagetes erecta]
MKGNPDSKALIEQEQEYEDNGQLRFQQIFSGGKRRPSDDSDDISHSVGYSRSLLVSLHKILGKFLLCSSASTDPRLISARNCLRVNLL